MKVNVFEVGEENVDEEVKGAQPVMWIDEQRWGWRFRR